MPPIPSRLDPAAERFRANREAMLALVEELRARLETVRQGGGEAARERHRARGKLLPRDRVELLLDPGTTLLELSPLAAWDMYGGESPGASLVAGIGRVSGRLCVLSANDPTVKGGAIYPMTLKKMLRTQQIARENRLPVLTLVESAGANLLHQAELFADQGGRVFANQARLSREGIPQIALVFGSSTAGGAYIPGMSDYVVMVKKQARVFLAGPPLVKMAIGEVVEEEALGGADTHGHVSGVSDYTAQDDRDALRLGREIVARLLPEAGARSRRGTPRPPRYDVEELLGIVPVDPRRLFDMREVIARIVDDSDFLEFKSDYGNTLVCGHAALDGWPVGILANNGILFSESSLKAAQFIQLCNQSRTPLIFLQNIHGFMVGGKAEREGIIKHGSKMINAVATSSVPHLTVILGGSYGAGNYGMCGRSFDPRFLWSWPSSRVAVMGGEQAAGVLRIVAVEQARARGKKPDEAALDKQAAATREQFARESSALYATARLWDDGLIDPRQTREVLAAGLAVVHNQDFLGGDPPRYGVFRM